MTLSARDGRPWLLRVVRAQLGDRRALDDVLRALQDPLFAHVRRIVQDDDVAADALQETLLRVARGLPAVRDPRWTRAWAYRIATREALRRGRAEHRWRTMERDDVLTATPLPAPDEPRFDPELRDALAREWRRLSPASEAVLRLHYHDSFTLPEIAEVLELPLGTVKSRLAYGLATLRRLLAFDAAQR